MAPNYNVLLKYLWGEGIKSWFKEKPMHVQLLMWENLAFLEYLALNDER